MLIFCGINIGYIIQIQIRVYTTLIFGCEAIYMVFHICKLIFSSEHVFMDLHQDENIGMCTESRINLKNSLLYLRWYCNNKIPLN